jgi:hypothetical protein
LKEIFTDKETMKTSTVFAGDIPKTQKDLHCLIYSFLEFDENFKGIYGLQKILQLNECVGIGAFTRRGKYKDIDIVEGMVFLKSKYIGSGIGFWIEKKAMENFEEKNIILIASAWAENKVAIKLMKKNEMIFSGEFLKRAGDRTIKVESYIRCPKHLSNISSMELDIEELLACKKL